MAWFKSKILTSDEPKVAQQASNQVQGVIAKKFRMFYQLVRKRDDQQNKSLLDEYMQSLAQVRSKFNDLKSAGEIGPAAIILVKQTINNQNSVFNQSQKMIDESIDIMRWALAQHDPEHWFYLYADEGTSEVTFRDNWCPEPRFLQNANGPDNRWQNNGPQVDEGVRRRAGLEPRFQHVLSLVTAPHAGDPTSRTPKARPAPETAPAPAK